MPTLHFNGIAKGIILKTGFILFLLNFMNSVQAQEYSGQSASADSVDSLRLAKKGDLWMTFGCGGSSFFPFELHKLRGGLGGGWSYLVLCP